MTDSYQQPSREWWAQRWIDVLESFGWVRRLARARVYAREGNVLNIEFKGPKVFARVQGTAPDPYKVTLSLDPFTDEQWHYVIESMSQRAIFSAKLLAGEMPQNIEEVFTANGLSLFPFTKFDIHSRCSCPDPANPCKHIGAVYYLLGDRFSEDPFVLFQLRGRTKEQVIEALRQTRGTGTNLETGNLGPNTPLSTPVRLSVSTVALFDEAHDQSLDGTAHGEAHSPLPAPLTLDRFWDYPDQLEPSLVVIAPSPSDETVLDVLGPIPLNVPGQDAAVVQASSQAIADYLKAIYPKVSEQAVLSGMNTGSPEA